MRGWVSVFCRGRQPGATGGFPPALVLWDSFGNEIGQFNGGDPTCSRRLFVAATGSGL
jgi:hypothetical protein